MLTVFRDVNGLFCGSVIMAVHAGEVLALLKGQTELVSQSGFQELALLLQFHGGLAFGLSRQEPSKVKADARPSVVTHCHPERRVWKPPYGHTHQKGSWKRKQEVTGRDGQMCQLVCDPLRAKNILCSTSIVLFSGALRLRCSTEQLKFWPEYNKDGKRTELRARTQPSARSSISVWLLMLLPLFPTRQNTTAAGAMLSTEHTTSVYSSPLSHPVRESRVMLGRAVGEKAN